jgi:hypothetical protein
MSKYRLRADGTIRAAFTLCLSCVAVAGCGEDSTLVAPSERISPRSASTTQPARILSTADRARFRQLAAQLPGREGVAVSAVGRGREVQRLGTLRTATAWSTAKIPVAMAATMADVGNPRDVRKAITASDNAAAERLWAALGGGRRAGKAATAQLRAAGDPRTEVQSVRVRPGYTPFGQTIWALTDQTRFAAGMACLRAGRRILRLMGHVVGEQRWGLGSVGRTAKLKGGWGPYRSGRYLVRQMAVVELSKGRAIAVTAATIPANGGFDKGRRTLTRIARWLVAHADGRAAHPRTCG